MMKQWSYTIYVYSVAGIESKSHRRDSVVCVELTLCSSWRARTIFVGQGASLDLARLGDFDLNLVKWGQRRATAATGRRERSSKYL